MPSRVTGLAAISISAEVTFMFRLYGISNSSHDGLASGASWRLIFMRTDLLFAISNSHNCSMQRKKHSQSATPGTKRSPFAELHGIHPTWPFSTVVFPPFDHGSLWSAAQLSHSHFAPSHCSLS